MKYKIGDKVKAKKSSEVHEIVGVILEGKDIVYKVTSKEVDIQLKEVVNGFSFYKEDELESIK